MGTPLKTPSIKNAGDKIADATQAKNVGYKADAADRRSAPRASSFLLAGRRPIGHSLAVHLKYVGVPPKWPTRLTNLPPSWPSKL
jgi:hypothetical protein